MSKVTSLQRVSTCTGCGKHLKNSASLQRHRRLSLKGLLVNCKINGAGMRTQPIRHHPDSSICNCTWCGKHLKNSASLKRHRRLSMKGGLLRCKITGMGTRKRPTGRFLDPEKDHYETPRWAWEELLHAVRFLRRRRLWDPFFCSGATKIHWTHLRVPRFVCSKGDFFHQINRMEYDVVVTNPPFSTKQLVLDVLVSSGKPFVVLMRTCVLFTKWFRLLVPVFKLVLPSRQVDFTGVHGQKLTFDCVFVCVRCGPKDGLYSCMRTR